MTCFALLCPPYYSHLRLFEALGAELFRRGHRLHLVVNAGAGPMVGGDTVGMSVQTVGVRSPRALARLTARAAGGGGPLSVLRTVHDAAKLTDEFCRGGPALLRSLGVEAVIGDQMEPAAGLLARHLRLPQISLAAALPVHDDPSVPLPFLSWPYDSSEAGLKRNRGGVMIARWLLAEQRRVIAKWASRFGLGRLESLSDCLSPRCQISQLTESFDFPRPPSPIRHAVGPIRTVAGSAAPLPLRRAFDRQLVFASFGTLQGHRAGLFRKIAAACRWIGADCVVAHCGRLSPAQAKTIDAAFVTDFLPQRAMLHEADLCVTHAGMNTVLDALEAATPMLAIPMAFDQPGIAARIVHHEVGLRLSPRHATVRAIAACLERLLSEASYARNARAIGRDIEAPGGVARAADLIEAAVVAT
ncbi:glycosyltransferase [Jiella sp. MQZ9-1]|uniref:Glycosyltransferase family 1 protein n=1 Tax=Jiella flava TaxID=2816857 RepID=A0A939FY46_9HYPH|nr:glycosyltransferase [Jiella flava]MBO0663675.1 glycosyltransferase family 1 protein [Jiella flava]MCD2472248.1 glycosyltransferase [Jiella flava]